MDIFNDDVEVTVPEKPFEALVGDGKKYSDPDALAKALFHQNAHIARIQDENATFRTELAAAKRIEEMFKELKANGQSTQTSEREEAEVGENVDINKLVQDALATERAKDRFADNFNKANTALQDMYGEKAKAEVQKVADELGYTMDEMKSLAGKNPKAFLKYFAPSAPAPQDFGSAPPRGQRVPSAPVTDGSRKSYWDSLFKTDRKAWESRAWERHQAAMKAGESFFDN
jgi:hypothetical protein